MEAIKKTGADISICRYVKTNEWSMDDKKQILSPVRVTNVSGSETMGACDKLFCRRTIDELKFEKNIRYGEDTLFSTLAMQNADKIVAIENKLYYYFNNPNSAVHTLEHDTRPMLYKLMEDAMEREHVFSLKRAYKGFLSRRYLTMFEPNAKEIAKECNEKLKECSQLARKMMSTKERIKLGAFYYFPFLYRAYRLATDKTMFAWEKEQKKRYAKTK